MTHASTDPGNRSLHELERDVDAERRRVSDTIDALQQKVSVGSLVDQIVKSVGEHGGEASRNLALSLRQNPLAVILTGVGLAWLMAGSGPKSGNQDYEEDGEGWDDSSSPAASPPTDPDRAYANMDEPAGPGALGQRLSEGAAVVADGAKGLAREVRDRAAGAGSAVSGLADQAGTAAHRATQHAPRVRDMRRRAVHAGRDGWQGLESFFERQPLIMGALALAVGAAIGGALPRTRTEDELFGKESDRLVAGLRATAEEEGGKLQKTAAAVADEAQAIAGEAADALARAGSQAVDQMEGVIDHKERLRDSAVDESDAQDGRVTEPRT